MLTGPGHGLRLPADRLRRQQHRPVHLLALRRDRRGAHCLVVRGGSLRAGDRRRGAAFAHEGAWRSRTGRFMRVFARLLGFAMRRRWLTIGASLIAFGASVYGMGFVQKQFFPASNRPELLGDDDLAEERLDRGHEATTERLEEALAGDADIVASPPMSAAAPSASTCRSTCSSTTTSSPRRWSWPRTSKRATGCRPGSVAARR